MKLVFKHINGEEVCSLYSEVIPSIGSRVNLQSITNNTQIARVQDIEYEYNKENMHPEVLIFLMFFPKDK